MFKKLLLTLALTFALTLSGAPAFAQDVEFTAEELAALAKEPPLSQADIDIFIKIAEAADTSDGAADKVLAESGLSEVRMTMVLTKVSLGMLIASNVPSELLLSEVPPVLQPTEAEIELIKNSLDKLAN